MTKDTRDVDDERAVTQAHIELRDAANEADLPRELHEALVGWCSADDALYQLVQSLRGTAFDVARRHFDQSAGRLVTFAFGALHNWRGDPARMREVVRALELATADHNARRETLQIIHDAKALTPSKKEA